MPRHRIWAGRAGPAAAPTAWKGRPSWSRRLLPLVDACFDESRPESLWWAARLLRETLSRVPDARPYGSVLRRLADRIASDGRNAAFGAGFWGLLRVPAAAKTELLQLMLPADPVHRGEGGHDGRFLDVVDALATAEPETVLPLLCGWFTDRRALSGGAPADGVPQPTVASAAQALLYAHRGRAPRLLLDGSSTPAIRGPTNCSANSHRTNRPGCAGQLSAGRTTSAVCGGSPRPSTGRDWSAAPVRAWTGNTSAAPHALC